MSAQNSIDEQILEALNTKLTAANTGATVFRSRGAALALTEGSAILIEPEEEPVKYIGVTVSMREFMARLTILARGPIPDQVADSVRIPMHASVMSDPTLGGLVQRIVEDRSEWTIEEADQTAVRLEVRYKFIYATPTQVLTAQA